MISIVDFERSRGCLWYATGEFHVTEFGLSPVPMHSILTSSHGKPTSHIALRLVLPLLVH